MSLDTLFRSDTPNDFPRLERPLTMARGTSGTRAPTSTGAARSSSLKEVLSYVERDEKKHTGLAAIYLPSVLRDLPAWQIPYLKAKQIYWGFCLERMTYEHRHDAAALGIDLYEAMKRVLASQERIVGELGTRRGIWKNRWLEGMSLAAFRRFRDQNTAADRR